MLHVAWAQGNQGDSWLLMVGGQIVNLISDPSFGHNLCFKCPNGSCNPILDIHIPRYFQWYKELFNPMSFDIWNRSLKIWESTETPTLKVGVHLGVRGFNPSHSSTFPKAWDVTPRLPSWPAPLQAFALVMSPRLGLWQHPLLGKPNVNPLKLGYPKFEPLKLGYLKCEPLKLWCLKLEVLKL